MLNCAGIWYFFVHFFTPFKKINFSELTQHVEIVTLSLAALKITEGTRDSSDSEFNHFY